MVASVHKWVKPSVGLRIRESFEQKSSPEEFLDQWIHYIEVNEEKDDDSCICGLYSEILNSVTDVIHVYGRRC